MRCLTVVALVAVATMFFNAESTLAQATGIALKERDVKRLCEEYLKAETTDDRREKVIQELKGSDPLMAQRTLKGVFKDEAKRPLALSLSIALKVPGMFKQYSPFIDSEDEASIVELILVTQDVEGIALLVKRFKTMDLESASYQFAFKGFTTHRLPSAQLDPFFDCVKSGTRSEEAMEILRWQIDKPDLTSDAVLRTWPQLKQEFDRNFKNWPISGINLLEQEGWEVTGTKRYGTNVLLGPNDQMILKAFPPDIDKVAVTIRLRVLVLDGKGGSYSFHWGSYASGYIPIIDDKRWVTKDVDGSVYTQVPLVVGAWQEHLWELTAPEKDGMRKIVMKVDGKELIGHGAMNKSFFAMMFKGEGSNYLVGGYELILKK